MFEAILSCFDLHRTVAGLAGGVCVAFAFPRSDPLDIVGAIVVGGLFGNYAGETINAFYVGVVAMPLCKGWVIAIKQRQSQ